MDEKQKCMMCNSLLARTFVDMPGKRMYLCQQDANALLRIIAKEHSAAFKEDYQRMSELVYGNELPFEQPAPAINGGPV